MSLYLCKHAYFYPIIKEPSYITIKNRPAKRTKLNIVDIHFANLANKSFSYLKEIGTAGNKNMSE